MTSVTELPSSRWRAAGDRRRPEGAEHRVRDAQAHARSTLRLSLAFLAVAGVTAAVPHPSGRWLPLHLFLAGGAVLAISATTLFFTITWAAAPAPRRWVLAVQRGAVAVGAAGVAVARAWSWPDPVLVVSALVFSGGLVLLAALLVITVRRGIERRFDVPVAWYVTALVAGLAAAALGAVLGAGSGGPDVRPAHVTLNLLGLVGLVLGGTVPSFTATVARARMWTGATPRRHLRLLGWQAGALVGTGTGFLTDAPAVAAAGLGAYAAGVVATAAMAPRFSRRQLTWAGPRLFGIYAGLAWWAGAVVAAAVDAGRGGAGLTGRIVLVLAIGGLAQILWGSLCYLLPVLRGGGHERLTAGFATTRSWPSLVAVNVAAVALATGVYAVAAVATAWLAVESALRFGRVVGGR